MADKKKKPAKKPAKRRKRLDANELAFMIVQQTTAVGRTDQEHLNGCDKGHN